jgi:hypothetical protein
VVNSTLYSHDKTLTNTKKKEQRGVSTGLKVTAELVLTPNHNSNNVSKLLHLATNLNPKKHISATLKSI